MKCEVRDAGHGIGDGDGLQGLKSKEGLIADDLCPLLDGIGISSSHLQNLLKGKRPASESALRKVCRALGISYAPLKQYRQQGKVAAEGRDFRIEGIVSPFDNLDPAQVCLGADLVA